MKIRENLIMAVFIFVLAGITSAWAENITFVEIKSIADNSVQAICSGAENVIGALFNNEQVLVELKTANIIDGNAKIDFNRNTNDYNLKLLLWDNNMKPLATPCTRRAFNLQFEGNYHKTVENGTIVYSITDNGNSPMILTFDNDCADISISFDINVKDISADGAIMGILPYNDRVSGCGVGFCNDETNNCFLPYATMYGTPLEVLEDSDFKNKWIHITLDYINGTAKATYSDPEGNTVYVDNATVPVKFGIGSVKPINKLSFGVTFNGTLTAPPASSSFCIKNINFERK